MPGVEHAQYETVCLVSTPGLEQADLSRTQAPVPTSPGFVNLSFPDCRMGRLMIRPLVGDGPPRVSLPEHAASHCELCLRWKRACNCREYTYLPAGGLSMDAEVITVKQLLSCTNGVSGEATPGMWF